MKKLCIAMLSLGILACKPAAKQTPTPTPTPSTTTTSSEVKPVTAETKPSSSPSMVTVVEKPKEEPARYDKPTERRLYPSRAEADEIINQEMHPFFLLDQDENTGWAYTPEEEYLTEVKLPISLVEGATQVRLRIKTAATDRGYPKELSLVALPGRQIMTTTLAMTEDWQEVVFDLTTAEIEEDEPTSTSAPSTAASKPATPASAAATESAKAIKVDALKLLFLDAQEQEEEVPEKKESEGDNDEDDDEEYDGFDMEEWVRYVEVKEVEVFVTGLTKENPAFEKSRLEHILTWKKTRAINFKTKGIPLPIAAEYKSNTMETPKDDDDDDDDDYEDYYGPAELSYEDAFASIQKYLPAHAKGALERAKLALDSEKESWAPLQLATLSLKAYKLPDRAIGAAASPTDIYSYDYSDTFYIPDFTFGTLLLQEQLTITDSKAKERPEDCDTTEQEFFWRRKEVDATKPNELIIERCISQEDRGGRTLYRVNEILEYDEKGRVLLWVTPYSIQWFEWKDTDKSSHLAGVIRLTNNGINHFIDATNNAPPLTDDRPWLVLTSSKPLFDADSEKEINALKAKLVEAGFSGAESFDSRQAKNLSCCFTVLTAGRFKTKKEAQATAKQVKAKGFEAYIKQGW